MVVSDMRPSRCLRCCGQRLQTVDSNLSLELKVTRERAVSDKVNSIEVLLGK